MKPKTAKKSSVKVVKNQPTKILPKKSLMRDLDSLESVALGDPWDLPEGRTMCFMPKRTKKNNPWGVALDKADKWGQKNWKSRPNGGGDFAYIDANSFRSITLQVAKIVELSFDITFYDKEEWVPASLEFTLWVDGNHVLELRIPAKKGSDWDCVWFRLFDKLQASLPKLFGCDMFDKFI